MNIASVFGAMWVSEIWYADWLVRKQIHSRARAIVAHDRVLYMANKSDIDQSESDNSVLSQGSILITKEKHDELLAVLRVVQSHCELMVAADWRKWEELASPEEFERWVKSRAAHLVVQAKAAIAKAEGRTDCTP